MHTPVCLATLGNHLPVLVMEHVEPRAGLWLLESPWRATCCTCDKREVEEALVVVRSCPELCGRRGLVCLGGGGRARRGRGNHDHSHSLMGLEP